MFIVSQTLITITCDYLEGNNLFAVICSNQKNTRKFVRIVGLFKPTILKQMDTSYTLIFF